MSFVALGGTEAARPTFFELIAAERLMPSLKAATIYSLSVRAKCSVPYGRSRGARDCKWQGYRAQVLVTANVFHCGIPWLMSKLLAL